MQDGSFPGFGKDARRFFADLSANNNRPWFLENQDRYRAAVAEPAASLVADLGARLARIWPELEHGKASVLRIHRDVRFAKDKRPYKENLGVILWIGPGGKMERPAFYFHLEARSAFFYAGFHMIPKPVLERYRAAVADERRGTALVRILGALKKAGLAAYEEAAYKQVPRGYPKDHPRADLLRLGGLGVARDLTAAEIADPGLPKTCADVATRARPLLDWFLELDE